jgi:hypothetical protein
VLTANWRFTTPFLVSAMQYILSKMLQYKQQRIKSGLIFGNIVFLPMHVSLHRVQVYEPSCEDFGPLKLDQTYRFCWKLESARLEAS